ncbi:MAG: pyridoxamine 5'-phosphate oxidase family protein [Myxococcota bacterium]
MDRAPSPPWLGELEASRYRHRRDPTARYAQLATVEEGRPRCRTVVIRAVGDDGALTVATDRRSAKLAQLTHQPWAEICWYFGATRQQYRLSGTIVIETESAPLLRHWQSLSTGARRSFFWPPPGQPKAEAAAFATEDRDRPPANFAWLSLEPREVDLLELKSDPHRRRRWRLETAGWACTELNP